MFSVIARNSIKSGSFPAYVFAFFCVAIAVAVRLLLGYIVGVTLPYATFFPMILLAAVVAGPGAAIAATLGSLLIGWWAFYPPYYEIVVPDYLAIINGVLLPISSAAIVCIAEAYRQQNDKIGSQENAQNSQKVLDELAHRGRNSMGVVSAIVRNSVTNKDEANVVIGRIPAHSKTNELLTQSGGLALSFNEILRPEIEPYGSSRILTEGEPFTIEGNAARALSLVFHELFTNAVKYGALRHPDGKIKITWNIAGARVSVRWRECDGPPVMRPSRKGFGSKLVVGTLKELGGSIHAEFHEDGLVCNIDFALLAP